MRILRNRSLLIMATAEVVSNLGNWIAMQAIVALLIFKQGGGVGQSAALYMAGLGPTMLLGPLAGWLVDRFDRRRLMIVSELVAGAVIACMMFTTRVELIYLCLVLASTASTVMMPARSSVVPDVVSKEDLTRANAFMQQVNGMTRIGAPLLAAGLVAAVAPQTALLIDVISFALSALILTWLPALPPRQAAKAPAGQAEQKMGVLAVLRSVLVQIPLLRVLLPFSLLLSCLIISFDITSAVFVRDIMQGSIATKGMIGSLIGAGMGISSLVLMLLKGERNLERDYVAGLVLVICLPGSFALGDLSGSPTVARMAVMVGSLLGGLGIGLANVQASTLVQRLAPAGWLGRINGALGSIGTAGQVTGLFAAPLLVPGVVSFGVYFGAGSVLLILLIIRTIFALSRGLTSGPITVNEVAAGD